MVFLNRRWMELKRTILVCITVFLFFSAGLLFGQDAKPTGEPKVYDAKPTGAPVSEPDLDKSFKKLFPGYDNKPKDDVIYIDDRSLEKKCDYVANKGCRVYPVKKKGELLGFAIIWQSDGFKGPVKIILGLTQNGEITGLDVLSNNETPQLGGKIATDQEFQAQFLKRNLANTRWMLEKDGGDIRAITGASYSSKAVVSGVKDTLEFYEKNKENLKKKASGK